MLQGVPYQVINAPNFLERPAVRDALAYCQLAASPDDDVAFEAVVTRTACGIGAPGHGPACGVPSMPCLCLRSS